MSNLRKETSKEIRALQTLVFTGNANDEELKIFKKLIGKLKRSQKGTMSKSELADQYGLTVRTFVKRMNEWEALIRDLSEHHHYKKCQKLLLPNEIDCIYRHLGIPPTSI